MLKDVAMVIAGGLLEIITENIADMALPQINIIPGTQPYNTGDAVGAIEATVLTLVGVYKKPKAMLLGAGGLAVAVPNLVGKIALNATFSVGGYSAPVNMTGMSYTSTGKYGRNLALAPSKILPKQVRR